MKPYQKPPMEAAVLPFTEMTTMSSRPQRPPMVARGPPPLYKSRGPGSAQFQQQNIPIPAPRSSTGESHLIMPGPKLPKPTARYHPSLSGSETDVSTSTENLTQVRRGLSLLNFFNNR
jgi:hypothetical protein